jgi:phenylacetate-coenzyme A ligase PaaK-like adenylate-forming protein
MPVIRMNTGDRATWSHTNERCVCGRSARRLKLLGRKGRFLKIGGEKISSERLQDLGEKMAPCGELVQFIVHFGNAGGDCITAHARAFQDPDCEAAALGALRNDPILGVLLKQGRLEQLTVQSTPPTHMTGLMHKPRSVVDARVEIATEGAS